MLLAETGQPSILHTVDAARRCRLADRVLVATDDREILEAVQRFGAEAVMTDPNHTSGTDRIAEAAAAAPDCDLIVNLQGDEPEMNPEAVDQAIDFCGDSPTAEAATGGLPDSRAVGARRSRLRESGPPSRWSGSLFQPQPDSSRSPVESGVCSHTTRRCFGNI
jgi:CMP-2-keto-3-deoxyoctulosonic acid synthetase